MQDVEAHQAKRLDEPAILNLEADVGKRFIGVEFKSCRKL